MNRSFSKTKPRSEIWSYYTEKKANDKTVFECIYCKTEYVKNATRMKTHLLNCLKCPLYVKNLLKNKKTIDSVAECSNEPGSENTETAAGSSQFRSTQAQSSTSSTISSQSRMSTKTVASPSASGCGNVNILSRFFDSVTHSENDELDKLLARAIFASAAPLQLVENPYWSLFFSKIRPSYKIPSRYRISNGLLNNEYEHVKSIEMSRL